MANSGSGDSMVERVVRILGAFDRGHTDLSPSEVARRAGLPMSSAHRIVGDLLRTGLLERDLEGRVRIGMRLWELTTRGSRALVLDEDEVLVIEQLSAPDAVSNVTTVAGRLPLHASSSGLVLLAFGRQTLRNRILARPLPPVGPSTITDAAALGRRLDAVRRDGYAILAGSIESVATGISVPVADRAGTTVAVLSAVVPTGWPRERETLDALRRTAQTVSEAIADYGILTH